MAKWANEELLCNARGLDDGYLFIHRSNPLSQKLASVLQPGNTAKSRLASYGCPGYTGSVRPPLSNEIYHIGDDVKIAAPSSADKASHAEGEKSSIDDRS
jgi:hypothetical protein